MKITKNGKSCVAEYAWDAEEKGVVSYREMLDKVTGESRPKIQVKTSAELYLDLTGKQAVLYSPSIPDGEYVSWSGEIDAFNENFPGSIPTKRGYCPPVGGFRAGDAPYQRGGDFPIPIKKNTAIVRESNICIIF